MSTEQSHSRALNTASNGPAAPNSNTGGSRSGGSDSGNSNSGETSPSHSSSNQSEPSNEPEEESGEVESRENTNENFARAGMIVLSSTIATLGLSMWVSVRITSSAAKNTALRMYLRQNAVAFESDVSSGAGPVVDDLAAMFGISEENRPRFGRLLRRLYPKLRAIVSVLRHDDEAAGRFVRLVVEAARQDAALARDLTAAGLIEPVLHISRASSPAG